LTIERNLAATAADERTHGLAHDEGFAIRSYYRSVGTLQSGRDHACRALGSDEYHFGALARRVRQKVVAEIADVRVPFAIDHHVAAVERRELEEIGVDFGAEEPLLRLYPKILAVVDEIAKLRIIHLGEGTRVRKLVLGASAHRLPTFCGKIGTKPRPSVFFFRSAPTTL
jgi:hypothetical protein